MGFVNHVAINTFVLSSASPGIIHCRFIMIQIVCRKIFIVNCQEENSIYCKSNENIKSLVGKFRVPNDKKQINF